MPEPKTKVNDASVAKFLGAIADAEVRKDCQAIVAIMQAATKAKPKMWGSSIVGFGEHVSVNAGGKDVTWMQIAFSPRKQNIVLYLMIGGLEKRKALLDRLGQPDCGKGCLYIKRLADVHLPTLKTLVREAARQRAKTSR